MGTQRLAFPAYQCRAIFENLTAYQHPNQQNSLAIHKNNPYALNDKTKSFGHEVHEEQRLFPAGWRTQIISKSAFTCWWPENMVRTTHQSHFWWYWQNITRFTQPILAFFSRVCLVGIFEFQIAHQIYDQFKAFSNCSFARKSLIDYTCAYSATLCVRRFPLVEWLKLHFICKISCGMTFAVQI